MTVEPALEPYTMPVAEPTVATLALLLVQVPLPAGSLSVVVVPGHADIVPVIAVGDGFTEIIIVAVHAPDV